MHFSDPIGIISFGTAIPKLRIKTDTIAKAWDKDGASVMASLGVIEKAVPAVDEDTISLAANASQEAYWRLSNGKRDVKLDEAIGAIYAGSESHPYAVKSTAAIVGEVLGVGPRFTAADLEFACKAGTAAVQIVAGLVGSQAIEVGLAIGADTAQSRPGDALEYSAGAASAAFLVGRDPMQVIAKLKYSYSYTSDTPDFWRREHEMYPSHGGRFTGEPAYFKHIFGAVKGLLAEAKMQISDFTRVVLHMPNARFPKTIAGMLGATEAQLAAGFTVTMLGNSYSACSLVGLAATLEVAKPGEQILVCSYGSGSGSDAFIFETTKELTNYQNNFANNPVANETVAMKIAQKKYVEYPEYLRNLNKLQL